MAKMNSLRYAVVTGAGKGIGRAISIALAGQGYTIIACARTLADLETLKAEAGTVISFTADLSNAQGVNSLAQFVKDTCGTPNVLVNNLGVFAVDSMVDSNEAIQEAQMQVNFWSTYRLTMHFIKPMLARGAGHIINICSIASIKAIPWASSYSVSKHAQLGFSRNLQNDLAGTGVLVTSILPGNVDTPSWDGYEGDRSTFLKPEQVAGLVIESIVKEQAGEFVIGEK